MIINPLQENIYCDNKNNDKSTRNKNQYEYDIKYNIMQEQDTVYLTDSNDKIVNNLIEFLLEKHSETLTNIAFNSNNVSIIENIIKERLIKNYSNLNVDIDIIIKNVLDRFFGYYILQKHIDNDEVSDIRVINYKTIFIKKRGIWKKTNDSFYDKKEYINFVRYCVLKNGGKINNEIPIVVISDKKNNLRIEAGIEPVNVVSPNLVIRIHRPNNFKTLENLLFSDSYMFNSSIYLFLIKSMISGLNIIISGKGASGKTTLLRSLINKIPQNIAITSNEETAELFCNHENIIQREIIQNRNNDKNITLEKLSKQCLVMSNDAIVVGELKGEEALAFLDAVATGHRGYATIHSNNSKNTIDRLVTLMKRDNRAIQYTNDYLERILGTTIDVIIYMSGFKINEITEILYDTENNKIIYNTLFKFKTNSIINGQPYGYFYKVNEPKYIVKEKLDLNKYEIDRIMECMENINGEEYCLLEKIKRGI